MPSISKNLEHYSDDPWMNCMLNGAFEEAWKASDEVLKSRGDEPCWHLPRHQQWIWNGSDLAGKRVLIRCYHGLGDTIQFIRYAPLVKAIASELIVWAQPSLIPLLETVEGIDKLIPLNDGVPGIEYDVDLEIMELAHIFRATIQTIPKTIPYIHVEPERFFRKNNEPIIGLVWKAGDWDERRNIPFNSLDSLFDITNNILILQENAIAAGWNAAFGIQQPHVALNQYAQCIKALDLLITIDSMPAHLAGAMGVPVLTLLHADSDWRWMRKRTDSPWYPTMKLIRQQRQGDWQSVIEETAAELKRLVNVRKESTE